MVIAMEIVTLIMSQRTRVKLQIPGRNPNPYPNPNPKGGLSPKHKDLLRRVRTQTPPWAHSKRAADYVPQPGVGVGLGSGFGFESVFLSLRLMYS